MWQLLWILRIFVPFKWIERRLFRLQPQEPLATNVSLLASAIKQQGERKDGVHIPQTTFYIGGVGTLGTPQSRLEEAVTGNTITYKVRYAYRILVDNYCPGDEIFLFGFSRGAFAARATADFIDACGIFKKSAFSCFDAAWVDFTKGRGSGASKGLKPPPSELDSRVHPSFSIRCIGVWDTVGSLGAPPLFFLHHNDISTARAAHRRHSHLNLSPQPNADYAFQALALDERRFDFYPAVWSLPSPGEAPTGCFSQTWFPGVHTDVGGGKTGDLSQYAFIWMVSKLQENKLLDLDDDIIQSVVKGIIENGAISPWQLPIAGRDYMERIMPALMCLPRWIKDFFRVAHRNPYMVVASIYSSADDVLDPTTEAEQKFHWTVVQRIERLDSYWASCPALMKGTREKVLQREETPVGKDLAMKCHFVPPRETT
jgi:hypothetical protein